MAGEPWREPALTVRAAYKRYASQSVLRGLDMTVPQGCIYGLLGPSGCGKTTLFKSIVGRQHLDGGEIFVRARNKKNIGYMPQELSLYKEFSIKETLVYYGMLYGMSREQIAKRTQELVNLLSLPPAHHTINQLSGGQKRRVSFSVALLHNPPLLILDEPTVGVDPILCHNIWQHLIHLSTKEQKSVVITTHYIEEARQADVIGLMREGVLLAEKSPKALMDAHQCDSLEQVFLSLSQRQSSARSAEEIHPNHWFSSPLNKSQSPLDESTDVKSYRIKAQNMKTLYWMWRNIPIMIFILSLPITQSILFNFCVGRDAKGLHMGYVNEEVAIGVAGCSAAPLRGCHTDSHLSCRYLNTLEKNSIILNEFNSVEEGLSAVKSNDVWGLMHFTSNYSSLLMSRLDMLTYTSDEDVAHGEVGIWMDMSDQYIGNMLKRDLYFGFIEFQKYLFQDCGWATAAADVPVHFKDAVFGSNKPSFTHYAAPAMVTLLQFYTPMMFTVAAILMEKTQGLLDRNMVAGLNLFELIISHALIQMVMIVIQTVTVVFINFFIFDNPMLGNWPLFVALLEIIGINGMCYGFLVCATCSSDIAATVIGIGTFFPLTFLSGMIWPVEGMHYILRAVSVILPLTQSIEAYRAIAARDWSIYHPTVFLGFLSCFFWIAIFLLVSALIVKWLNGTGSKN